MKMTKVEKEDKLFSITNYLIQKHKITEPVKLQKILYFLYLEYLKENNKKLFDEEFEAWVYGPVLKRVYYHLKYDGLNFNEYESFDSKKDEYVITKIIPLTDEKIFNFIDKKINKYKNKNTFDLSEKAHKTEPWIKARKGLTEYQISKKSNCSNCQQCFQKNSTCNQESLKNSSNNCYHKNQLTEHQILPEKIKFKDMEKFVKVWHP